MQTKAVLYTGGSSAIMSSHYAYGFFTAGWDGEIIADLINVSNTPIHLELGDTLKMESIRWRVPKTGFNSLDSIRLPREFVTCPWDDACEVYENYMRHDKTGIPVKLQSFIIIWDKPNWITPVTFVSTAKYQIPVNELFQKLLGAPYTVECPK